MRLRQPDHPVVTGTIVTGTVDSDALDGAARAHLAARQDQRPPPAVPPADCATADGDGWRPGWSGGS